MKLHKLTMAMAVALATTSGVASAAGHSEMASDFEISTNIGITSDYVFRGQSQNDEDVSISGGFDVAHTSGAYAGIWMAMVDDSFFSGASIETDFYAGWGGEFGPVGVDVGYLRYQYASTTFGDNNTDEWHIGVSTDLGPVSAGLTYNYSPDFFGLNGSDYWDLGVEAPIGDFTIAAHYGWTDVGDDTVGQDYNDWSVGISTSVIGLDLDLTYTDADENFVSNGTDISDGSLAFSIGKSW